ISAVKSPFVPVSSDVTIPTVDEDTGTYGLFTADISTNSDGGLDFDGSFDAALKILGFDVANFGFKINQCGYAYFSVKDVGTVYVDFNKSFLDQDLTNPDTSTTAPGVLRTCGDEATAPIVEIAPA